jgi:hypothetical protein
MIKNNISIYNMKKFILKSLEISFIIAVTIAITTGVRLIEAQGDQERGPNGELPYHTQIMSRQLFGDKEHSISEALEQAENNTNVYPLNGNVGINTLTPNSELDVNGKITMQNQTQGGDSDDTVATKGYVDSQSGSGNIAHRYGAANHGTTINPPSGFTKSNCSFSAGGGDPRKNDGAYKRGRNYNTYWIHQGAGWQVLAAARFAQDNSLRPVTNGRIQYMLICTK